ncbi:hypothetical protein QC763_118430 [Podospora pseudopauciseta]|uniref:RRM domain-containing protein n=1 Tax=Podospora pseudopauciseta TaxID=2093780 RepID=A0ABR0I2R0_9PEZI|nr:hypothetical protein QC763_118430 [Podospora pseudopauciseta]
MMQSLRRAAVRSALSASRAVSVKTTSAPFAFPIVRAAAVSRAVPVQAVRWYSQEPTSQDPLSQDVTEEAHEAEESITEQTQEERQPRRQLDKSRAIFVRNIVFEVNEQHLKEAFETYGEIEDTYVARDPRGMSRGYGFVTFKDASAVSAACAAVNGSFWHGRRVTCIPRRDEEQTPRAREQNRTPNAPTNQLFVGNIPYETTDAELNNLFAGLSNVTDIRIAVDRTTGWPRGFAHVDFTDVASAEAAKEKLAATNLGGRQLKIDFATGYGKGERTNNKTFGGRGDRGDRGDRRDRGDRNDRRSNDGF